MAGSTSRTGPGLPASSRLAGAGRSAAARRDPAPGGLELVRAFLNSADIETGTDELATPAGAAVWLRARDLPAGEGPLSDADRDRLVELREALRDLITCRDGLGSDEAARAVLARAARSSPVVVEFGPDGGAELHPAASGLDGVVGRLLGEISTATVAGTWTRLKVCRNDLCRWAYYDQSRNHSGLWCSMAVCGNRFKGRAFRGRRRGLAPT